MKRTVALKLILSQEQSDALFETQKAFANACNQAMPFVVGNRCWNRVALHHLCYYQIRKNVPSLGSQMVCNSLHKVCSSYNVLKIKKSQDIPAITFKDTGSVHYDKRDMFLARRRKLQSNGSKSAKRCLKRISGRERRHVKETNHIVSKRIVEEAVGSGTKVIIFEELTNIRKRIKFKCSNCGSYQHSDRNAAINLLKLGESVVSSTAPVNMPMVAVS